MQDIYTRLEKLRLLYKQARDNNDVNKMKRIEAKGKFWNNVLKAREKWLADEKELEEKMTIFKTEDVV